MLKLIAFGLLFTFVKGESLSLIYGRTKLDYIGDNNEVRVLVKAKNYKGTSFAHSMARGINMQIEREGITSMNIDASDMDKLKRNKNIEIVELVHSVEIDDPVTVKTDDLRTLTETTPYGIPMVLQDLDFWDKLSPNGKVRVCVADTGYDLGHKDLPSKPDVTGSNNYYYDEEWNYDGHGRGTHCSGTVGAIGGNNKGVAGVISNNKDGNFQLIIAKALPSSGFGSMDKVMEAVETCKKNNANVISLSLGVNGYSAIQEEYYNNLYVNDGILLVAAAGNGGGPAKIYPASYPSVISVAAIDRNEDRASFSRYNNQVEISGPGVNILSTIPDNSYAYFGGTSMASAHVAAVAGLLWMQFPNCSNYQIRNVLDKTAKGVDDTIGCNIRTGYGLVQAKDAYDLLSQGDCGGDIGTDEPVGGCSQIYPEPECEIDTDCHDDDPCSSGLCIDRNCVFKIRSCDECGFVSKVKVEISTDHYAGETTWEIKEDDLVLMSGGPYDSSLTTSSVSRCFGDGSYKFIIYDSSGDGICCKFGQGSYSIFIDKDEVITGGAFDKSEATAFEISESSSNDSPTPFPNDSPTPYPTETALTPYPTETPPTFHPTVTPPTFYPTATAPTSYPTETPPTPYPTETPLTPYPTATAPTSYPTETPPTSYPTQRPSTYFPTPPVSVCKVKGESCENSEECCKKKCHKRKNICKK